MYGIARVLLKGRNGKVYNIAETKRNVQMDSICIKTIKRLMFIAFIVLNTVKRMLFMICIG